MEYVWFILIGIAAGWLAGQIMKGGGFGLIGDLIVGVIGALLGGFLFGLSEHAARPTNWTTGSGEEWWDSLHSAHPTSRLLVAL